MSNEQIIAPGEEVSFKELVAQATAHLPWHVRTSLRVMLLRATHPRLYAILRGFFWGFLLGMAAHLILLLANGK